MMKNKVIISIFVLLVLISIATIVNGISLELTPNKTNVKDNEEVEVIISIKDFKREGMQKAIEMTLLYNTDDLEYKKVDWENNWTGTISSDGTGIVATKTGDIDANEDIAHVIYLVKRGKNKNTKITASKILTSSDGDGINVEDTETTINIDKARSSTVIIICSVIFVIIVIMFISRRRK